MKLTPTESAIISALTRHPEGMSRADLVAAIRPGVRRVHRKVLDTHIYNLRKKLLLTPDCDLQIVHDQGGLYVLVDLKDEGLPQ